MSIKLWDAGNGIRAVIYRAGVRVDERSIVEGLEVFEPTAEEMADAPATIPETLVVEGAKQLRYYTGLFTIPGQGLAAIYGARILGGELIEYIHSGVFAELGMDAEASRHRDRFHEAMDAIREQFRKAVADGDREAIGTEDRGLLAAIHDKRWEIVGSAGGEDDRLYLCRASNGSIYAAARADGAFAVVLKRD